jgi:glycosyltransferase involved in cell wall biosynthesis
VKIVQIIARVNQGGTARWLEVLISELRKLGHDVALLAGKVEINEVEDSSFEELGGKRIVGLSRSVSILQDFRTIIELRKYLKLERPDIVNTHTAKAGVLGRFAASGLGIKVVHTYHGHLLYGYFSPFKTKLVIVIEKLLAQITTTLISVGDQVRKDLLRAGIGKESQYLVIHPGIPHINFKNDSSARSDYGLKNFDFVVGWLGRLTEIKQPTRVIELAHSLPDCFFLIGGEGEMFEHLKIGLPKNVKILGWVKPGDFWPACDVALLTSKNEGLPTSLIEAAFAGKPIISEDVGSAREIFENGIGGYLVKDFDSRRTALETLKRDPALVKIMGESARKYAELNFSVEQFVLSHLNAYN